MSDLILETPTELNLKQSPDGLGLSSLLSIRNSLNTVFGKNVWLSLEMETISITLGIILDELMVDKINVLKIIETQPDLFCEDPAFMLYATEVINNNVADFESIPACTSLELAFAIEEVKALLADSGQPFPYTIALIKSIAYILRKEGYSEPIGPFGFIPKEELVAGQTPEDTANKLKAIQAYIYGMRR